MDFLLSELALQREDGSWLESAEWFGFYSLQQKVFKASANGLPPEKFIGLRFDVGLPEAQDKADPQKLPAGHALHPLVNGLHWGWQGGYVYLALEGRWTQKDGTLGGFSYHLARTPNRVRVTIPVTFQGGGPVTLQLALDPNVLLEGLDFNHHGTSSHSREGDPVLPVLKANIAKAFRLQSAHQDVYQDMTAEAGASLEALPADTHPYPLNITGRFPQVRLPADNPLSQEGVALGKSLFHDSRLSSNNSQSCANCHDRSHAFSDPRTLSVGAEGQQGKRHAMPLFNLAWAREFFWDGRSTSLRQQVLMPIQDQHEMNETLDRAAIKIADQASAFTAAFGSPEITPDRIAKALEQYLLTLVSQESRFDRSVRKVATMTQEEKLGLQLFVTEFDPARGLRGADCFHCHGGTLFTDYQYKNNGLDLKPADEGRMAVTGNAEDLGKFKTPSLRNIAATAPYMHDGRFATLEEVVEHYSTGVQRSPTLDPNLAKHPTAGLQLTPAEKRALVAFLKTLTDDGFIGAESEPSSLPGLAQRP